MYLGKEEADEPLWVIWVERVILGLIVLIILCMTPFRWASNQIAGRFFPVAVGYAKCRDYVSSRYCYANPPLLAHLDDIPTEYHDQVKLYIIEPVLGTVFRYTIKSNKSLPVISIRH